MSKPWDSQIKTLIVFKVIIILALLIFSPDVTSESVDSEMHFNHSMLSKEYTNWEEEGQSEHEYTSHV